MENKIYETAKELLSEGCSVIPIRLGTKEPVIKWTPFEIRVPTEREIAKWFARTNHQIGLITGVVSQGRFILDFDGTNYVDAFLDFLDAFPEFETGAIVRSGSGKFHIHGVCPDMPIDVTQIKKHILDENGQDSATIELRANRVQTLIPPSKHPSGGSYEFISLNENPTVVTRDRFIEIVNYVRVENETIRQHSDVPPLNLSPEQKLDIANGRKRWVVRKVLFKGVGRNDGGYELGRYLNDLQLPIGEAQKVMVDYTEEVRNVRKKNHEYTYEEAISSLESAYNNQPRPPFIPHSMQPEEPEEPIDTGQFAPMSVRELTEILGLTIVKDDANKVLTFLCGVCIYTHDSQWNESFNAPTSTGKSYIALEVSKLFPDRDVLILGYVSPMAFFHELGTWDKERKVMVVDLSKKLVIFIDQPYPELLVRLRALFSHDQKEITSKIVDKNQKAGHRTKTVIIKGFPSVIFCSAGLKFDEQESSRFLLLSPETDQEKLREAIEVGLARASDTQRFNDEVEADPGRAKLKERIKAIRQEKIEFIVVRTPQLNSVRGFFLKYDFLHPKHQRDLTRVMSIIKALALLNVWFRERDGSTLFVNDEDVVEGLKLWEQIVEPQEYNLPPYIYNEIYKKTLIPLWEQKHRPVYVAEVLNKYFQVNKRVLSEKKFTQEVLPLLESQGLVFKERDESDKRKYLIHSSNESAEKNASSSTQGS